MCGDVQSKLLEVLRCEVWHELLTSGRPLDSAAVCGRVMRGLSSQSHLLVFVHSHMTKRSQGHHNSCSPCACVCVYACVCHSQWGYFTSLSVTMICVREKKKKTLFVLCANVLQDSSGFSAVLHTIVYCLCLFCGLSISFRYLTCFLSPVLSLQEVRGAPSTTAPDEVSKPTPPDNTHTSTEKAVCLIRTLRYWKVKQLSSLTLRKTIDSWNVYRSVWDVMPRGVPCSANDLFLWRVLAWKKKKKKKW